MANGYNDSGIINIPDNKTGIQMLDKLSRLHNDRCIQPLNAFDNIIYEHRGLYTQYNLKIGDTAFIIPPEFIMVNSESTSQSIVTLRQENTMKQKSGYHKRVILVDLVFNGIEQLNGYPVKGPEGTYYVDGLRQLLAQFKCTPFLPITNELINGTYGIFTVVLQSINMQTVEGFPNMMKVQLTLQEVEMFPYIEMPNVCFQYMIDWDLFRFYYQSFLTEDHEYKKLQSLHANKERNRFKISILSEDAINRTTSYNFLDTVTNNDNFVTWVDSKESNCHISSFACGYSNILTNIQLSNNGSPTVQFMGGMDTIYNIIFETTDYTVVQSLEQCQITNDCYTRNNAKLRSLGFVKLESELVEFTGSLFVMVESVTTNTVPEFPGLYNVQIQCVAFDIAQSQREGLNGFMPFDCTKSGKCGEYVDGDYVSDHVHDDQVIEQSMNGLKNKVKQDNYAEWKLRTSMEVYPDLRLPTYDEVDEFIEKCKAFRSDNGLSPLPYNAYPMDPTCMLHGQKPDNKISINVSSPKSAGDLSIKGASYRGYVDPDFYVFYPFTYASFERDAEKENDTCFNYYKSSQRKTTTKTHTRVTQPWPDENADGSSTGDISTEGSALVEQFIAAVESKLGKKYVWGAESEAEGGYDCTGLPTYGLRTIGAIPNNVRLTTSGIVAGNYSQYLKKVDKSDRQRGDLMVYNSGGQGHCIIYEGGDQCIEAMNPKDGIKHSSYQSRVTAKYECYRPIAFINDTSVPSGGTTTSTGGNGEVWNALKSYGLSDVAIAGIMGNMQAESGIKSNNVQGSYKQSNPEQYNNDYVRRVNNGQVSKNDFVYRGPGGSGFGLVQFTYSAYKKQLYEATVEKGKSIDDVGAQVAVFIQQIKSSGVFNKINSASSVREASNIMLHQYEKPANQSASVENKRAEYGQNIYNQYAGKGGGSTSGGGAGRETPSNTLTKAEFESICRTVMGATQGQKPQAQKAVAQLIYDRLTSGKYGKLATILEDRNIFNKPYTGALNSTVETYVKQVFCEGNKMWPNNTAIIFLSPDSTISSFKDYDRLYDRFDDEVGTLTFWGKEGKAGSDIKYTIVDGNGTGSASQLTPQTETIEVTHKAENVNLKHFGQPVFVKTDAIIYEDGLFDFWENANAKDMAKDKLNDGELVYSSSFCDEVQYSHRGRLVRAFPAYLFCVLDDQSQWYRGDKLWTNYYTTKSVVDIQVHAANDMPTETATIVVTNAYHNLDRTSNGVGDYSLLNDNSYGWFAKQWYKMTGLMPGLGPKLTDSLIKLHQVIYDHAKLREGARVHLRMGYGSDPLSLAPMINGFVSDVQLGDQISVVITSDGAELIQQITSAKEKDTNNGLLGLFGLMEDQESSNIIADVLCKRQSWFNYIIGSTFEANKFSIEHFGLYFNQSATKLLASIAAGTATGAGIGALFEGVGAIPGALIGATVGTINGLLIDGNISIADLWNGYQEQYDLLKNIYKAAYDREHYIYSDFLGGDKEENVVFNQYNMTPWDVFQVCTQNIPEFIIKPSYHQFDSRVYFGLPSWMEKYRYDYLNGKVYEECKTSAQVHLIESLTNIIDNQVRVTSRYSNTNCKVMYTRGSSLVSTKIIHSDDTIDYSKQKTTILDTTVTQDALGPDFLYELFGLYSVGKNSARRIGISNLLYGWQQQYQGELLTLGHPGVKPHDYIMTNDSFANMFGISIVREVIHSFNTNTGYTTSITPGMIGFSSTCESGMIEVMQNYLATLADFTAYMELKRQLKNNYEISLTVVSGIEIAQQRMKDAIFQQKLYGMANGVETGFDIASFSLDLFVTVSFAKNLYNLYKGGQIVSTFMQAYKGVKGVAGIAKVISGIRQGATAVGLAAAAPTGGLSLIVPIIVSVILTAIDILLGELFDWIENRNVCVLLPMWWEGYPFVAGVKDGTKILLMQSDATATKEANRDAQSNNDFEDE